MRHAFLRNGLPDLRQMVLAMDQQDCAFIGLWRQHPIQIVKQFTLQRIFKRAQPLGAFRMPLGCEMFKVNRIGIETGCHGAPEKKR